MAEQLNLFGEPTRERAAEERAKAIAWELSPAEREAVRRCGK